MILVTGATGNIGRELVRLLVTAGEKVRAMTRDRKNAEKLGGGVEVFEGDLDRPESIAEALRGVDKLFLLAAGRNVPGEEANAIDAAKKAGVKHVVQVSTLGVAWNMVGSAPLHIDGEKRLKESGLAWTILRPGEFMSNAFMWQPSIKGQGAVYLPTGDGKQAFIHPHDIAAVAAKVLTTPGHAGKIYELTGGEALSAADCAAKLGAAIGKPVKHVDIPEAAFREQMAKFGAPPVLVETVARLYTDMRAGKTAAVLPTIQEVTGRKPRTFDDWAKENAAAFA